MGFLRRLFGRKRPAGEDLLSGMKVIDFRSDEERQIEREAEAGLSLGPEVDSLVAELIEIGRSDGFLSMQAGGKFNKNHKHIRAREVGTRLNEIGGMKLMQATGYRVGATLGAGPARELESAWGYIGEWLP